MTPIPARSWLAGLTVASALALAACASQPHHDRSYHDELLTQITPGGVKQFTFIETMGGGHGGWHGHGGMSGGMGGSGMGSGGAGGGHMGGAGMGGDYAQKRQERMAQLQAGIRQRLDARLAASGYCHNGYTQGNSQFQRGQIAIQGQCVDPPSPEDRTRFPNASP